MRTRITRELPQLEEYIKELSARFDDYLYHDPIGERESLKQKGSVQEYQKNFEELTPWRLCHKLFPEWIGGDAIGSKDVHTRDIETCKEIG